METLSVRFRLKLHQGWLVFHSNPCSDFFILALAPYFGYQQDRYKRWQVLTAAYSQNSRSLSKLSKLTQVYGVLDGESNMAATWIMNRWEWQQLLGRVQNGTQGLLGPLITNPMPSPQTKSIILVSRNQACIAAVLVYTASGDGNTSRDRLLYVWPYDSRSVCWHL